MKRREILKIAGLGFAGLLIPDSIFGLESIVGNVKDVLASKPVEGANLKIYKYPEGDFIAEYNTDSRGNYNSTISGVDYDKWIDVKLRFSDSYVKKEKPAKKSVSNIVKAEITHPDYYNAVRYFDLSKKSLDVAIIPKTFDMNFFDSWTRGGAKPLKKWTSAPVWLIQTKIAERAQIDLVKDIIRSDIHPAMGWSNPIIEEINTEENIEKNMGFLVYWVESGDYYGNHHETLEKNQIVSASTWFLKSNKLRRVFLRQLTQGLGFVNNISGSEFYTSEGNYTQQGLDMLKILDAMAAGNFSPDSDPTP